MLPERPLDARAFSDRLRLAIVLLHSRAGGGHLGSALSIVEILSVLLAGPMRWRGDNEPSTSGDRLIVSKGHAAMGLYCALALEGHLDAAQLLTFGRDGSPLEPHPNERAVAAVHASTGSLGQGLSIGVGLALGARLDRSGDRSFVIIGDGELNEGQTWEAARCAAVLELSNLIVVLDDNGMQQDGPTRDIMRVHDAVEAWGRMGWLCADCDGHDCDALADELDRLVASSTRAPRLLHARTIKGRGIAHLEGRTESHFPPPVSDVDIELLRYSMEAARV
jgi:transketolase